MPAKYLFVYLICSLGLILSYNDYLKTQPVRIEGKVTELDSGSPVSKAHVFITKGEEETFSDHQGTFLLETLKSLPVTITIEKAGYSTEEVKVTTVGKSILVSLKKK